MTDQQFTPVPKPEDTADGTVVVNNTEALTGVIQAFPEIVKESKAGYKTTEFWLAIVTSLLVVFNGVPLPEKFEGFVVAAIGVAYALSRGLAKQGVPVVEVTTPPADAPTA